MSVEFDWDKLDSSLSRRLVEILNRVLSTVTRPSFIGPVEVTSLEFGTVPPDIEIVDMRDIYRDFLEDDEDSDTNGDPVKVTEGPGIDDDGYEWVSRRALSRALNEDAPSYHHVPPHMRYGRGPSTDMVFTTSSGLRSPSDIWTPGLGVGTPGLRTPMSPGFGLTEVEKQLGSMDLKSKEEEQKQDVDEPQADTVKSPDPNVHPNIQLHFRILHQSDLRITITTSLLINYPSPMFMSLPIKLSVIGLVFNGEVVVAYEGSRKRVHLCILDDLDPYGPASERRKRDSMSITPSDGSDESGVVRGSKPLPLGQRLLPSIYIESEIGQADKHVLKNVNRVEKFIQDVIRKTVEEELVFPNFHTLILAEP